MTYAQVIVEAAKKSKVSAIHLAVRLRQEKGTSNDELGKGVSTKDGSHFYQANGDGNAVYYNFFNIGAAGSGKQTVINNGGKEAKAEGWTSPYLAIMGGAVKVYTGYIGIGQDTIYFEMFSVVNHKYYYWKQYAQDFLKNLGMNMENIRIRDHEKEELSHYSNATSDLEYLFPFGWGELWGIADRTDFDLMQHQNHSGQDMSYMDPETHEKYVPYCIEPSLGADRVALAFLIDAYDEETLTDAKGKEDTRIVLRLHPALAPYKVAVLPLSNKLKEQAEPIYEELSKYFSTDYDTSGSIGKRYRRQDEIGTPFCVCVDFDTAEDHCVTIRDRDTMEQIRLPLSDVREYINSKLEF